MDDFTRFERDAWDTKASSFADTWGAVTVQNISEVLRLSGVGPQSRVLDVGCGYGDLGHAALRIGATVAAVDASVQMCGIARRRFPSLRVLVSEAEDLPCDDGEFSAVILNYLLLHVADQAAVLREAARCVSISGVLCWTNWVPPAESVGMRIIFEALSESADFSVIPPAPDIFQFSNTSTAVDFLQGFGFADVKCTVFPSEWRVESGEQFFAALQGGTRIGGLIERQTSEVKSVLHARIVSAVEKFRKGGSCVVPMPTHIFTSRRVSVSTKQR